MDTAPRVVSVNVGQPRVVIWNGEAVETSIFKTPVAGPVPVVGTSLAGDRQADPRVHGGPDKAVYAYAAGHYAIWRRELNVPDLAWGAFGENLTLDGFDESSVRVGDRFAVGTAEFEVSQPRMPCFKMNIRFGRADMVKLFLRSGRLGFYLRVRQEGAVEAGDAVRLLATDPGSPTIADLGLLETTARDDVALLERAMTAPALTESWRERYRERRAQFAAGTDR